MQEIKRFQIRGVPGEVVRTRFDDRIVDYWTPRGGSEHLLIAHDGQNVFDGSTSTHRRQTWKMAQSAIDVANEQGVKPPTIIGVWHSATIFEEIVPAIYGASSAEKTAVIGSSMGGLATLYAAIQHPDKFRTALALSPHWVISDENFARSMVEALPLTHKIWMSRGDKGLDKEYVMLQNFVDTLMRQRGFTNNFESKVYKRSGHNERSWAKYLHDPLRFWLNA
jgi:pimeloyl-ACP methyl ester carboxylesterase